MATKNMAIIGSACILSLSICLSGCKNSIEADCENQADDPANGRTVAAMAGGRDEFIKACVAGAKAYSDMK